MVSLVIEGNTLGEIHHKYNKVVNEAVKNNDIQITDINYNDPDFDNLFKIDIASKNRDVDFILRVLKCRDMLYVTRALKKNTWLVTEEQYAHIINPEHLYNTLKQEMTSKAFNKLMLQVRLNLRDEKRVEEFYKYYEVRDLQVAMKWLHHCSNEFIEKVLEKHANDSEVTNDLIRRLCEKSMSFLDIYCRYNNQYYKREALFKAMFVMKTDVERYLDIIEALHPNDIPYFTPKYTKILMTKCRERIMKNMDKYCSCIDCPTFAKFLSQEEAKDFILKYIINKNNANVRNDKIKYFLNRLPPEDRFEFTKSIFIDKVNREDDSSCDDVVPFHSYIQMRCPVKPNPGTSQNIYAWYVFAPFNTAFTDLKKLIRSESNPNERLAILTVILTTVGHNMENMYTLLKYYRENHINEPFKFKIQFVNIVLSKTNAYKYDQKTWQYLKDIFSSMEVFSESDKNLQQCVRTVLIYCIINDQTVPEIVEKKFQFETLDNYRKKLTPAEKDKVFNYLFEHVNYKIQKTEPKSEKEFYEIFGYILCVLTLLCSWDKNLEDYPSVLKKIKQIIAINQENGEWNINLSSFYNKKKSWRKLFFTESLLLNPEQETILNVLKHDPKLIEKHRVKIFELLKGNMSLDIFFKKLRVYWPQSLAKSFKEMLMENLQQNYNHKPFISGLCSLMQEKEVTEMINKYVPSEFKIDWSQHDEVQLYIRKFLAMCMHSARPQPSLKMALLYAKGDYLQYALPSLNAILYNMSSADVSKNLTTLLNAPVSLQKHGIRTAILKLKHEELKQILSDIWKSNKNSSIRADIFVQNFNLLCKENNEESVKKIWELLKMFIDNLTAEEDKKIYTSLSKVEDVPMCIRGDFWMKSYTFLHSLPARANCESFVDHLINRMNDVMVYLDDDLVANIFMKNFDKNFCTKNYPYSDHVASFLLSTKTEEAQMARYRKVFVPIFEKSLNEWDTHNSNVYHVRNNMYKIIKYLSDNISIVLDNDMLFPIKMFEVILDDFQQKLSESDNYILITMQKMALIYIRILKKYVEEEKAKKPESAFNDKTSNQHDIFKDLHKNVTPEFSELCVEHLKEDVSRHFRSIYLHFFEVFNEILNCYKHTAMEKFRTLKVFLSNEKFIEGYLFVLQGVPEYIHDPDDDAFRQAILKTISENPDKEVKMHLQLLKHKLEMRYV